MKIVGPTIVEPWREQIEKPRPSSGCIELRHRLHDFTVLDPACGSGNFLYIAYRELKRLEARIYERMQRISSRARPRADACSASSRARNFFGMDIKPFAVEMAKVTMMIARKLAIDELHITEPALPLDNLDANFIAADALIDERQPRPWPKADVIIGNPPFLGAKRLKPERGPDYVNAHSPAYPEVPGMADYCVYWFRKAHDHLPPCTAEDPVAGRAGLVGTQNIRNNQSRVGGLDHVVQTGTVIEAVDNQPWSGEANVHVSIVNWVKSKHPDVLPVKCKLWYKVDSPAVSARTRLPGVPKTKDFELVFRECKVINSSLSDRVDVAGARDLAANRNPLRALRGLEPGNMGFLLTVEEARSLVLQAPESNEVLRPFLNGDELVSGAFLLAG